MSENEERVIYDAGIIKVKEVSSQYHPFSNYPVYFAGERIHENIYAHNAITFAKGVRWAIKNLKEEYVP